MQLLTALALFWFFPVLPDRGNQLLKTSTDTVRVAVMALPRFATLTALDPTLNQKVVEICNEIARHQDANSLPFRKSVMETSGVHVHSVGGNQRRSRVMKH